MEYDISESVVLTLVKEECLFLFRHGDIRDTANENRVVPGLMHRVGLTLEDSEAVLENRAAVFAKAVIDPFKPVVAGHGEAIGQMALLPRKDVYGKLSAGEKLLTMSPDMGQAEQNQWRIEGHGTEGVYRYAERFPRRASRGNNRNSCGEATQCISKFSGVKAHAQLVPVC